MNNENDKFLEENTITKYRPIYNDKTNKYDIFYMDNDCGIYTKLEVKNSKSLIPSVLGLLLDDNATKINPKQEKELIGDFYNLCTGKNIITSEIIANQFNYTSTPAFVELCDKFCNHYNKVFVRKSSIQHHDICSYSSDKYKSLHCVALLNSSRNKYEVYRRTEDCNDLVKFAHPGTNDTASALLYLLLLNNKYENDKSIIVKNAIISKFNDLRNNGEKLSTDLIAKTFKYEVNPIFNKFCDDYCKKENKLNNTLDNLNDFEK